MPLTIEEIIDEADVRVPNAFSEQEKIDWLNHINYDFFESVKIPKVVVLTSVVDVTDYDVDASDNCRERNITRVNAGNEFYQSMAYVEVNPKNNYFTFEDSTNTLSLYPAPPLSDQDIIVRFNKVAGTTFTSVNKGSDTPDAPEEYHSVYILGLCEHIAKAMNDTVLGNNYANDYRGILAIAQQNHAGDSNE